MKHRALILSGSIIIIGVITSFIIARWLFIHNPKWLCGNSCQITATADRQFYSDELILVGDSSQNQPFIIQLSLSRKKIGNNFLHYYSANVLFQKQSKNYYTEFVKDTPDIIPNDFLRSLTITPAQDLSSREQYDLALAAGPLSISAKLQNFNGDFLVKNSLDYTKYASEGDGEVTIGGKVYQAHAYLEKSYSADYAKYVFFGGYDDLKSLSQFFVLWDQQGNFYLLDTSKVDGDVPNYKSHTWILYKNKAGNYMKKAFTAEVQPSSGITTPKSWNINIPDLALTLKLMPKSAISEREGSGLVEGTIETPSGTVSGEGYFLYHNYGSN